MLRPIAALLLAIAALLAPFAASGSLHASLQEPAASAQVSSPRPNLDKELDLCRQQHQAEKRTARQYATMLILCCILSVTLASVATWIHWQYLSKLKNETDERVSQLLFDSEAYISRIDNQKQEI